MGYNSTEFAWKDITVTAMGRPYERILEIEYDVEEDKKMIYGRGSKVKGIQPGRQKPSGTLTIGQSEFEAMLRRAQTTNPNATIRDMVFDIQVHYQKGTDMVKDRLVGCEFTKSPKQMKEGDSDMVIKLPFMMMDVLYNMA